MMSPLAMTSPFSKRAPCQVSALGDELSCIRLGVLHGAVFHRFLSDAVIGAFHGDGIASGGDGVFQGEVAERGIGIDVPAAFFLRMVMTWLPSARAFPLMRKALSKVNRVSFVQETVLTGMPS